MSEELEYTYTAETIEDAISTGLQQLGLRKDEVEVEILEEGNKGLFGLGARLATVRLIPLKPVSEMPEPLVEPAPMAEAPVEEMEEMDPEEMDHEAPAGDRDLMDISKETVMELLEKMGVRANVSVAMSPPDDRTRRSAVMIDITGNDMSILIGRKAETLNALQYITRLIVGKELGRSVLINIDVQGYRKRKEESLKRLAQTVARQAIETGRRQYLEPMSPAERRIIHIELRGNSEVSTESIGEGSHRKVTISPVD